MTGLSVSLPEALGPCGVLVAIPLTSSHRGMSTAIAVDD